MFTAWFPTLVVIALGAFAVSLLAVSIEDAMKN